MRLWSVTIQSKDDSEGVQVVGIWDSEAGALTHAQRICSETCETLDGNVTFTVRAPTEMHPEESWFDLEAGDQLVRAAYVTVHKHYLNGRPSDEDRTTDGLPSRRDEIATYAEEYECTYTEAETFLNAEPGGHDLIDHITMLTTRPRKPRRARREH